MLKSIYTLILLAILASGFNSYAQEQQPIDVSKMTREDVLNLSYDELLEMPFEDVMKLADIVGVSLEELYEMILNKDVTSASKKAESNFKAPLSTSVVSYDEIIDSGAKTIEEALRLIPGIIVREKTNGNYDVHIRGLDNTPPNHMFVYSENSISLVMIDDRPVYNYVHGGTFWETLPIGIEDIDRIEVVRGPCSALYGPNAVSGVVNIITKKPDSKKLSVRGNVEGGKQSSYLANIGMGQKINNKISFRITGNYQHFYRNSDLLYVFKAQDYISKEELLALKDPSDTSYPVFDPSDDIDEMYPDPKISRQRYGANGYFYYDLKKDINFNLSTGYQYSDVLSSTMGDNPSAYAGRLSSTEYVDLRSNIKGLKTQINILNGWQDIVKQDTGFKTNLFNLNITSEYDWHKDNLYLRPGVSYQKGIYNDDPYLRYIGQGFLNGKREISSIAFSLRADYLLLEKIRLVAALRGEKYSIHNNLNFSYQFIGSYNLNDQHNFRVVYSKANRGPFLVDSYGSYMWDRTGRPDPGYIYFEGTKNLDLLTMNMFEFGYRAKPTKNIQVDIEAFYSITNNYGVLFPDSVSLFYKIDTLPPPYDPTNRTYAHMSYQNLSLSSKQFGITGMINCVLNENLTLKFHLTYQQTKLYDFYPLTQEETLGRMFEDAYMNGLVDLNEDGYPDDFSGDGIPDPYPNYYIDRDFNGIPDDFTGDGIPDIVNSTPYSTAIPDTMVAEKTHKSTPSVYGGFIVDYKALEKKLNVNLNTYFYSEQTFDNKYGDVIIDPKFIVNLKVSYKVWKNSSVYINARNIIQKKREFGFMDEIGSLYMAGIHLDF